MIRYLLVFPILLIAIIVGLSIYLQPDDLRNCNDTVSSLKPCTVVDAVAVVSGGDTNARTDEAIRLYKNGWSDTLIFSGAAEDKSGLSNAAAMQARATSAGVPKSAILLDEYSETTKQNAENSHTLFASKNIKSIILVTSGYHQRRASLEFNKPAKDMVILNHPVSRDQDWSMWWWTNARGWMLAVSELFKIIAFNFEASR
ncbi:YdcF family protein [Candidatus Saccharibacteria bacterium]|nr:YdcF family protein [Candidatus Saccharibacteria bacterium]